MKNKPFEDIVTNWEVLEESNLHYRYFFDYYPLSQWNSFPLSNDDWETRFMIWAFKGGSYTNSKGITFTYKWALDRMLYVINYRINKMFRYKTSNLYLFFVPCSKKEEYENRYKILSELLCGATKINNTYGHIKYLRNTCAKNKSSKVVDISHIDFGNDDYYKGKNILLFDDVITSGNTMKTYASKLESLGANVIGCMAICKSV